MANTPRAPIHQNGEAECLEAATSLTFCNTLGSQRSLRDELVEAPIKDDGNPDACQQRSPGERLMITVLDQMKLFMAVAGEV